MLAFLSQLHSSGLLFRFFWGRKIRVFGLVPSMATQQTTAIDPAVLDDIIRRLTEVRLARPGKQVQLSEVEIKQLCTTARDIFLQQPNLLELEAPIKICGMFSSKPNLDFVRIDLGFPIVGLCLSINLKRKTLLVG